LLFLKQVQFLAHDMGYIVVARS